MILMDEPKDVTCKDKCSFNAPKREADCDYEPDVKPEPCDSVSTH